MKRRNNFQIADQAFKKVMDRINFPKVTRFADMTPEQQEEMRRLYPPPKPNPDRRSGARDGSPRPGDQGQTG